ncbi:MAG: hypothetical protein JW814_00715 [Candidatus Krumholzibacteriota bacterium]|nr:hypothetical protein [Candidatus Krumholzibacteriota bacterium]
MVTKKFFAALAFCLLAALPFSPLQAQVHFDIGGGIAAPTGDLNDYWGMGPALSGTILFPATPFISVGANIGFSKMGFDHEAFLDAMDAPPDIDLSGGDLSVISACGEIRLHAGAMEKAYVFGGAGLGLFHYSLSDLTDGEDSLTFESENKLGGYIHAGVAMPITPIMKIGVRGQMNFFSNGSDSDDDEGFEDTSSTNNYFSLMGVLIIGLD